MRHNYIKDDTSGDHWAVARSGKTILVQIQQDGEQVRIQLDWNQAYDMVNKMRWELYKTEIAMAEEILASIPKK